MTMTRCQIKRLLRKNGWVFNQHLSPISRPDLRPYVASRDNGFRYLRKSEIEMLLRGLEFDHPTEVIATPKYDVGSRLFAERFKGTGDNAVVAYRLFTEEHPNEEA